MHLNSHPVSDWIVLVGLRLRTYIYMYNSSVRQLPAQTNIGYLWKDYVIAHNKHFKCILFEYFSEDDLQTIVSIHRNQNSGVRLFAKGQPRDQ